MDIKDWPLWYTNFLIKNLLLVSGIDNNKSKQDIELAQELHKPIIRNFKKRAVYSRFKDNILGADLADMPLIIKFNKEFRFLLCVIVLLIFLVNMLG